MIVFLLSWSSHNAVDRNAVQAQLRAYAEESTFFSADRVEQWASPAGCFAASWVAHAPADIGGVRYVFTDESHLTLFAGRPICWLSDKEADGRIPIDPRYYLQDPAAWSGKLDGRFFAGRYDDGTRSLVICTDPMGAYPVFRIERAGTVWISNAPSILRSVLDNRDLELGVVAEHVGCGWSLDGRPWWHGVERLSRGALLTYAGSNTPREQLLLPVEHVASAYGCSRSVNDAAELLVVSVRALADWPGRPNLVPVTGGKDSRLVLPAAIAAGVDGEFVTGGTDDRPDVVVARALCARAGVAHRLVPQFPYWSVEKDHLQVARLFANLMGGMVATHGASGFPTRSLPGPLVLWHSGQGGEIARGYYGTVHGSKSAVVKRLFERVPSLGVDLLLPDAAELLRRRISLWVDDMVRAGANLRDVPDMFYLLKRMPNWAAPSHACVEFVRDTTSPVWSSRMLPYLVGASVTRRAREYFHYQVLRVLDASLLDVPFADDEWRTSLASLREQGRRIASLGARLVSKVVGRRRYAGRTAVNVTEADSAFAHVMITTRDLVSSQSQHPAWAVLDRAKVMALLQTPPAVVKPMGRRSVWRLLDVFSTTLRA